MRLKSRAGKSFQVETLAFHFSYGSFSGRDVNLGAVQQRTLKSFFLAIREFSEPLETTEIRMGALDVVLGSLAEDRWRDWLHPVEKLAATRSAGLEAEGSINVDDMFVISS